MFIEEKNLRLLLGGIVVILSTVGSGVCLVMLDFDSEAGSEIMERVTPQNPSQLLHPIAQCLLLVVSKLSSKDHCRCFF